MRNLTRAVLSASVLASLIFAFGTSPAQARWEDRDHDRAPHHAERYEHIWWETHPLPTYVYDADLWYGGRWVQSWHDGRYGWWWVAGSSWYLYNAPVYPYPDVYAAPVYVAQPVASPAPAYVVQQQPTVIQQQPTTYISQSTATVAGSGGTIVNFVSQAPAATVDAQQTSSTYVDTQGRTCRDYKTTVKINGKSTPATGKACQQSDGTWRIVQ